MKQEKHEALSVAFIITKLELGGAQKVCLSLYHDLQARGIKTFLITSPDGILMQSITKKDNLITIPSLKREVGWRSWYNEFAAFFQLVKLLRQLRVQDKNLIVHTHSTKAGILGRWAALCAGVKRRIHTVHGFAFHSHQRWSSWLTMYAAELLTSFITSHFVCVSSVDMQHGSRLFPFFARRASIIRAAVDTHHFYATRSQSTKGAQSGKQFVFGTIACFKPQKNIFDLLRAFHQVYRTCQSARLEIIGDGIQRPLIEEWIAAHQLEHVVTLHGWQSDVAPFMSTWNAFVLSSLWEGLPCALIEARIMRLPVICYDTGGIRDILKNGINGFLIEQKNWQQLAQQMNHIIMDKKLYQAQSSFADDFSDFTLSSMLSAHANLYRRRSR